MAALGHLDCNAFRGTLLFGHLEMARLLWSFCNGDKFMEQAMIKSGGYGAFVEVLNCRSVSVSVKIDMLRQVFEWSSLEVQRAFFTIAVVMQVNLY